MDTERDSIKSLTTGQCTESMMVGASFTDKKRDAHKKISQSCRYNKNRADLFFRSYDRSHSPTQSFLLTFLYAPRYRVEAPRMHLDVLRSSHDTITISE